MERSQGYCQECQRRGWVMRPSPNHMLHLLLSILTLGVWVVIWIICCIPCGIWRCEQCGSRDVSDVR